MEKLYVSGLDSAWGGRQKGALCHLLIDKEQDTISLIDTPVSVTWDDAIDDIGKYSTHLHHVIAIDQGLIVPNATKMRPVERMLASALGSMHCSAYPSNLSNESCYGPDAGIWRLLGSLNNRGYVHQPLEIPQSVSGRFFFECYPHPAIIGLMELEKILKYKARHRDSAAWNQLIDFLSQLPVENLKECLEFLRVQNKANEDKVDAIVCAYIAYYWWRYGPSRSTMVGSLTTGYIVTPHTDLMLSRFQCVFGDQVNNPTMVTAEAVSQEESLLRTPAPVAPQVAPQRGERLDRDDLQWSEPVTLRVTDTGNLSRTMREGSRSVVINEWMDRFTGHRLVIKLIDQDGEPEVAFVPHSHSDRQMTLKPDGTNQPGVWSMLVAGASKQNVLEFTVTYCYEIAN